MMHDRWGFKFEFRTRGSESIFGWLRESNYVSNQKLENLLLRLTEIQL